MDMTEIAKEQMILQLFKLLTFAIYPFRSEMRRKANRHLALPIAVPLGLIMNDISLLYFPLHAACTNNIMERSNEAKLQSISVLQEKEI